MGSKPALKALSFCQLEEISVLSGWDSLFKIYNIVKKNKYKSQKNLGYKR